MGRLMAALGWCSLIVPAMAADLPDAGRSLDSVKQAPELPAKPAAVLPAEPAPRPVLGLPSDIRIAVHGFRISGAQAFPASELLALVAGAEGQELTLAELQAVAARITRYYRAHGYLLAWAYLPAQEIRDGQVEIAVLEGRLGKVTVDNRAALSPQTVERHLAGLHGGEAVKAGELERDLLMLNDLPGVGVKSTLRPGATVGTTDLDIRLEEGRRLTGALDVNNYGNRYIGDLRGGLTLNVNNPSGLGDAVALRGVSSGNGLSYGRLAYQLPVNGAGTRLGAAYSEMRYQLGMDFSSLQAHGSASVSSLYLLQPFVRGRFANLNAQLAFDRKRLEDRVDATATLSGKTLDVWTLGLSGDRMDRLGGGGLNTWSVNLVSGSLVLDPDSRALDAVGLRTEGSYLKLGYQLARLQRLGDRFSLYGQLSGQWAGKNLDSAEKFSLGGPYGVRAYPQGEAPADDAWLLNLELRYRLADAWQLAAFADGGEGRLSHRPLPADGRNTRALSGAGLGLVWSRPASFGVSGFLAWKTAADPSSDVDRSPRVWVQGVKYF